MIRPQTKPPFKPRFHIDQTLFATTLALLVIGLWMVFDSSYAKTLDNPKLGHDAFFYLKKQAGGAVAGLLAMFVMMRFGYWRLRAAAVPLLVISIILLCAVWLPHIGIRENHAARWVNLGLKFQPSELAKLTLLIYLASVLARPHTNVRRLDTGLAAPLCVTGLCALLIEREPDLGTAAVLFLAVVTLLFLAGARKRHIALILGGAAFFAILAIVGLGGKDNAYRIHRLMVFISPDSDPRGNGYQIHHSRLAVGSGEWMGVGWGQGKEKFYLPQANTDFIVATVAEEWGFVGVFILMALLCVVGARGFQIARQTRDRFGSLLAGGIAALISWQALVNIAVVTASIPATGVPLPFISFGSSSLLFALAGIGILLNIAQHPTPPGQSIEE